MRESEFIVERLIRVASDVDLLYKKYFKSYYDYMAKYDQVPSDIKPVTISTEILQSQIARKANRINPCKIFINHPGHGNAYDPNQGSIFLTMPVQPLDLARSKGGISDATRAVTNYSKKQGKKFVQEFKPLSIKGSIHHELSHWIDDTLHGSHIRKRIEKAGGSREKIFGKETEAGSHIERAAQIHNIAQLKRHHSKEWDELSFDQMVMLSPSLGWVQEKIKDQEGQAAYNKWRKQTLHRMSREGLLGKNMTRL